MSVSRWWVVTLSATIETTVQVAGESPDYKAVDKLESLLDEAQRAIEDADIPLVLSVRDIGIDLVMGPYGSHPGDV